MSSTAAVAYPWRDTDETAAGGPDVGVTFTPQSSHRTEQQMTEEYATLKEAGMPLDSMKLVLNEDLSAVRRAPLDFSPARGRVSRAVLAAQ